MQCAMAAPLWASVFKAELGIDHELASTISPPDRQRAPFGFFRTAGDRLAEPSAVRPEDAAARAPRPYLCDAPSDIDVEAT